MGFIDELQQLPDAEPRRMLCSIRTVLESLPDDEAAALAAALADARISHADLSRVLKSNGHPVTSVTVGRHRRRECQCER